jgi:hypothetical protein
MSRLTYRNEALQSKDNAYHAHGEPDRIALLSWSKRHRKPENSRKLLTLLVTTVSEVMRLSPAGI